MIAPRANLLWWVGGCLLPLSVVAAVYPDQAPLAWTGAGLLMLVPVLDALWSGGALRGLEVGALFEFTHYIREDQEREYLVESITHMLQENAYGANAAASAIPTYSCSFTALFAKQSDKPYRPPRLTPKPVVQGPQTAVVVGKEGEEIWTDKYGRVQVQFPWDREGAFDENSSL